MNKIRVFFGESFSELHEGAECFNAKAARIAVERLIRLGRATSSIYLLCSEPKQEFVFGGAVEVKNLTGGNTDGKA